MQPSWNVSTKYLGTNIIKQCPPLIFPSSEKPKSITFQSVGWDIAMIIYKKYAIMDKLGDKCIFENILL